jgi:hypothetical protein
MINKGVKDKKSKDTIGEKLKKGSEMSGVKY